MLIRLRFALFCYGVCLWFHLFVLRGLCGFCLLCGFQLFGCGVFVLFFFVVLLLFCFFVVVLFVLKQLQ